MGVKYVSDFSFPADFGFSGSTKHGDSPRAHSEPDDGEHDGSFLGKGKGMKKGGRVKKMADGGPVDPFQQPGAAPMQAARAMPVNTQLRGGAPVPGQPSPTSPMSRATITLPATDAQEMASKLVQAGQRQGAQMAMRGVAAGIAQRQAAAVPGGALSQPAQVTNAPAAQPGPGVPLSGVPAMANGGHITAAQRHNLAPSKFVFPETEGYPIDTPGRARSALSRASANLDSKGQAKVRNKVAREYPSIHVTKPSGK